MVLDGGLVWGGFRVALDVAGQLALPSRGRILTFSLVPLGSLEPNNLCGFLQDTAPNPITHRPIGGGLSSTPLHS